MRGCVAAINLTYYVSGGEKASREMQVQMQVNDSKTSKTSFTDYVFKLGNLGSFAALAICTKV